MTWKRGAGGCSCSSLAMTLTCSPSLQTREALQWRRALIAGRREDKLIGLELTLDTGKMLQSMPKRRWLFHVRRPLCHLHDLPPCSRGLAVEVSTHYRQEAPGT